MRSRPSRAQARRDRHHEGARRHRRQRIRRSIARRSCWSRCSPRCLARRLARRCHSLIAWAFGAIIPLPVAPSLHPAALALSFVYGLLTALAFALWPLGRAHDISVSTLFRDQIAAERSWPRRALCHRHGRDRRRVGGACHSHSPTTTASPRSSSRRRRSFCWCCGWSALLAMALARRLPRLRSTHAAARHRQYPSTGRADADRHAFAWARALRCS